MALLLAAALSGVPALIQAPSIGEGDGAGPLPTVRFPDAVAVPATTKLSPVAAGSRKKAALAVSVSF